MVKVINATAGSMPGSGAGVAAAGIRVAKTPDPQRKVETLCKQEKANRIVAEAIARAKARGERNIPRVLNQDELPAGHTSGDLEAGGTPAKKKSGGGGSKKKSPPSGAAGKTPDKKMKVKTAVLAGGPGGSKSKSKTKPK